MNATERAKRASPPCRNMTTATAAPVVSESFYPFTGFTSATSHSERRMGWNTRSFGTTAFDLALETAAESGWSLYELPHRHTLRTDGEAVRACAGLVN